MTMWADTANGIGFGNCSNTSHSLSVCKLTRAYALIRRKCLITLRNVQCQLKLKMITDYMLTIKYCILSNAWHSTTACIACAAHWHGVTCSLYHHCSLHSSAHTLRTYQFLELFTYDRLSYKSFSMRSEPITANEWSWRYQ